MEIKVIIFLAFASLAQSAYTPNLTVSYGLSDEKVPILRKLIKNQESTKTAAIEGSDPIFYVLGNLTAALIVGSEASIDSSALDEALCKAKSASDLFHDSILLAIEASCSAVETSRNETYDILDAVYSQITAALKLAECGNYSKYQDAIEDYQSTVEEYLQNLAVSEYNAFSTCLCTNDSALLNVLEVALNGSLLSATHQTNSIFNAIKVFAAAASGTYSYVSVTCEIEAYRYKASIAHRNDVENKFIAGRTVFINTNLNQSGIAACIAGSQRADIVSLRAYIDGNIVLFKGIVDALNGMVLGIGDEAKSYYSQNDNDLATVIAQFDEGDYSINDYSLFVWPEANVTIAEIRAYIHTLNVAGDIAMNNAFLVAKNESVPNSEALTEIETLRHEAVDPAPAYTELFFGLFRNNVTFDATTEAELVKLQNFTIYGAQGATNSFLDAVIILANATSAGEVTEADFAAVAALLLEAFAALEYFSQTIAAAGLIVCSYINGS